MIHHIKSLFKKVTFMGALLVFTVNLNPLKAQNNVGINTSDPNSTLEIRSTGTTNETSALDVTDANGLSILNIKDGGRVGIGTITPGARFMVVGEAGAPTMNILHDGANGMNPALRVNDNGRVGIGTTSPGARFMVVGEAGAPTMNILHDGTNPTNPALRVNDDGNVGIGTAAPAFRLDVDGDINASGLIRVNGMMVASDSRYKNSVANLANSLSIIGQLRGTKYFLNNTTISSEEQFGFIAQEIEKVLPNLVMTDKKGYKSVNYVGLIPVLTEGIKTQQLQIKEQAAQIATQEKEIEDLKSRLKKIEALLNHK